MWHSRPPRDPPPFMANAILNFHFDFLNTSLTYIISSWFDFNPDMSYVPKLKKVFKKTGIKHDNAS